MNKKLLTAAIAAAVALPMAAQAGVQIYGKVHVSVDYTDNDVPSGDPREWKGWTINSGPGERDSRIGFKGSEDLGNGLKAIWKFESTADFSDGTSGWGGRNAYIGLAGDWGTALMGRHDTPLKISTGRLDYFADTMADNNNTIGFEDVRAPNVIAYISPNMNGLTFAGAVHAAEGGGANGEDGLADGYSLALMYSNNGIYAAAAYEDLEDAVVGGTLTDTKWRVGLGYDMNNFGIAAVYEDQSDKAGVSGADADLWQISAKYSFGNNVVKGMFGQNDPKGGSKTDGWAIGFDHKLSKRTMAYVLYADSENGLRSEKSKGVDASGFSLGMVHKF